MTWDRLPSGAACWAIVLAFGVAACGGDVSSDPGASEEPSGPDGRPRRADPTAPLRVGMVHGAVDAWRGDAPPSKTGTILHGPSPSRLAGLRVVVPPSAVKRRVFLRLQPAPTATPEHVAIPFTLDARPPFDTPVVVEVPLDEVVGRVRAVVDGVEIPAHEIGVTADGIARVPGVMGGAIELFEAPPRPVVPPAVVLDPLPVDCLQAHERAPELASGPVRLDVRGVPTDVWCDMETDGGGWALVYAYRLEGVGAARPEDTDIDISPHPGWPGLDDVDPEVPRADALPLHPESVGALPFDRWRALGDAWLLRSTLTHWVACQPAGGDLVEWTEGAIACRVVRHVADRCFDEAPGWFVPGFGAAGVAFDRDATGRHGVVLEHGPRTHARHDPCGRSERHHVRRLVQPRGSIWVRPSRPLGTPEE